MISTVIIDDEAHNRKVISTLLQTHCPDLFIAGQAENAQAAFTLIVEKKPQLVFLDVKMPGKTGFDLLRMFEKIDFETIFVSAFNEYAVDAFEFNALGYVLKPIEITKLIKAVNRAADRIRNNNGFDDISYFLKTSANHGLQKIALHHNDKVVLVDIREIVSVEATKGICEIQLRNNKHYYSSKDLKLFDGVLRQSGNFMRVCRNSIVNLEFVKSYRKGSTCFLEMQDGREFEVSRRKKTELISRLKPV